MLSLCWGRPPVETTPGSSKGLIYYGVYRLNYGVFTGPSRMTAQDAVRAARDEGLLEGERRGSLTVLTAYVELHWGIRTQLSSGTC